MTIGGLWVVVPLERMGGPTAGDALCSPRSHAEAFALLRQMQPDHDMALGLAYFADDEHERRDESGAIVADLAAEHAVGADEAVERVLRAARVLTPAERDANVRRLAEVAGAAVAVVDAARHYLAAERLTDPAIAAEGTALHALAVAVVRYDRERERQP